MDVDKRRNEKREEWNLQTQGPDRVDPVLLGGDEVASLESVGELSPGDLRKEDERRRRMLRRQ